MSHDTMPVTVTGTSRAEGGWLKHALSKQPFIIWEKPRGRGRFEICESGAGLRGTARRRGAAATLAKALAEVASMRPSTPAEILADIPLHSDRDHALHGKLTTLAVPGTRLWKLPRRYGEGAARGVGQPATALGLALNSIEALFGEAGLNCWSIDYELADGARDQSIAVMALDDARRAWWILNRDGWLVAGGPPIYDPVRGAELAVEFDGIAQLGLGTQDPDNPSAAVVIIDPARHPVPTLTGLHKGAGRSRGSRHGVRGESESACEVVRAGVDVPLLTEAVKQLRPGDASEPINP
ncbi:hypothetical protein [Actinomadura sp. 3N407]|uniref:hypothetical protein n=1 Tax=Actinomadura sp. 3N407 TaxID=3457423 RepID=UPI003FCC7172